MEEKRNNSKYIILICILLGIIIALLLYIFWPRPVNVKISFDEKGGIPVEDITIREGTVIELPDTEKVGYTFAGWYWNDVKQTKKIKVNENRKLIAKWSLKAVAGRDPIIFSIKYNSDGGSNVDTVKIECGKRLSLPTPPTRNRFIFKGWKDRFGRKVENGDYVSCEDQEFTAVWEKIIEYMCPDGYTLRGNKCLLTKEPDKHCKEKELDIGNKTCLRDYKKENTCGSKTIAYRNGAVEKTEGVFIEPRNSCFYGEETSYEEETCISTFGEGHYENNTCYVEIGDIVNECPVNHIYFTEEQLQRKTELEEVTAGCYEMVGFSSFCEEEYTLENDQCVKTIDATIKP